MRIIQGDFNGAGLKVGIVISRMNDVATKQLLAGVLDGLRRHGVEQNNLTVVYVPGLLELPSACRKLAARGAVDVVVVLATILADTTIPADATGAAVISAIAQAGLESGTPISSGIVRAPTLLHALQQASERSGAVAAAAIETARDESDRRMKLLNRTRLILLRHGETAANRELRYIGSRDDVLTERGEQQAQQLAAALAALSISAIYASPRRRTRDTAAPLAAALGLPVAIADELRENAFGDWEGMSRAEVVAHSPAYAAQLRAWEADPAAAPPGGESITAMAERVTAFAAVCCRQHPNATIVLVSHVGPVKALIAATLGVTSAATQRMFLDPATISVADWAGEQRILRLFNSHAHLGWTAARWLES